MIIRFITTLIIIDNLQYSYIIITTINYRAISASIDISIIPTLCFPFHQEIHYAPIINIISKWRAGNNVSMPCERLSGISFVFTL